jgi:glycosyltransferase involved in cell wall biosynthesis
LKDTSPSSAAPLRILHVIASMASEQGGPPVVCAGLTSALAARGHEVTIATLAEPGETAVAVGPGVKLRAFGTGSNKRYAASPVLDQWLEQNVAAFDIVHIHSIWLFPTFAAARACWRARKPYVVVLHGMLERFSVHHRSRLVKTAYWYFRERRVESRAAALHCLNHSEIRKAVPWIRDLPKFVMPNGIHAADVAALPARGGFRAAHPEWASRPLVLFLSRLHPKKGLDRLLPAWKRLAEAGGPLAEARLLVAGAGEAAYVASLKQMVADLGLGEQVAFLGQLTGRAKWQALVDSDVFVLPSHQEGFSMAITEALAAGCVPVVTEECNFDELAPPAPQGARGVIIRDGDMGAFVRAVADLLQEGDRRRAMADAGRALVASRYTWQKIAGDLEAIYRRILAGEKFPANPRM